MVQIHNSFYFQICHLTYRDFCETEHVFQNVAQIELNSSSNYLLRTKIMSARECNLGSSLHEIQRVSETNGSLFVWFCFWDELGLCYKRRFSFLPHKLSLHCLRESNLTYWSKFFHPQRGY